MIFTRKNLCWSLFLITLQAWGLQQRCFPVNNAQFLRTAFSIKSKIFREISASKCQGQHATNLNRYGGLCLKLKQKSTVGFPMEVCKILEQLVSRIILGGCFWKESRGGEGHAVTLVVSSFHFFQGSDLFIKQWSYVLSLQIFT